jgi:hypothetical protein
MAMVCVRPLPILLCALAVVVGAGPAAADYPPPPMTDGAPESAPATQEAVPAASKERETSVQPKPVLPPPAKQTFEAEPVRDGAIIAISLGFAGLLELINSTGEVQPQQISPSFNTNDLLWFDRGAVTQSLDPNASMYSNLGMWAAMAYAVVDPILSGYREDNVQAGIVDGIIYAESLAVTYGVTNLAKISVRRPRPIEYIEVAAHKGDPTFMISGTDASQSFFSGHSSITGAATATATYLAFARSPGTARPWITLIVGTVITGFVSYERVRAGAHFPSDVLAGAVAGGGIGVLVTHFHRSEQVKQRPLWIGYAPEVGGGSGGVLSLSGQF